jgi:hypothetical protein
MLFGYVVNVFDDVAGSELAADASAAATSLSLVDLMDFNQDPEGGTLKIDDGTNNETLTYTVPSGSTGTVNLGAGLAHSYVTGTRVTVVVNGQPVVERWADIVEPDGEEPLRSLVPHHLYSLVGLGSRSLDEAEHVTAGFEGEDLVLQNVLGKEPVHEGLKLAAADLTQLAYIGGAENTKKRVRWLRPDQSEVAEIIGQGAVSGSNVAHWLLSLLDPGGSAAFRAQVRLLDSGETERAAVTLVRDVDGSYAIRLGAYPKAALALSSTGASDFEFATSNGWQPWTPTLTGWSANPTNVVYRYKQIGKLVHLAIRQLTSGTSNATTKSLTLPVTAATITNMVWDAPCGAVDNGVLLATPARGIVASGGTTITFDKDWSAAGGWTNSGNHRIATCNLVYEAA